MVKARNELSKPDRNEILDKLANNQIIEENYYPFGDGNASEKKVRAIDEMGIKNEVFKMKYALIGCGRISTNHIKAAINNGLDIVALCDVIPEKCVELLTKHGLENDKSIKIYSEYKNMIEEIPDIQLISIATESGKHAEIAMYCISKNINVIIEKPIAMSLEDADKKC